MKDLQSERTVVLVKPDGVKRGLTGEIIARFEKMGLKIRALKMVWADDDLAKNHYPESRVELMKAIGEKTLVTYEKYGMDPGEKFGKMTPEEIGQMVNKWNIEFLTSGPVVAILLEGLHAVDNVRALVGATMPVAAQAGTIRGDYSLDSAALAECQRPGG